jgi:hypothetical protein
MRMRTMLTAAALIATGARFGWPGIATGAGEKKPEPAAKTESSFTPAQLAEQALHRRGVEAVNWGMSVVNYDQMAQAMLRIKADFNQIVFWSGLSDWKNQTLTPNPDVIYFKPFFNTRNVGPIVLEIPPAGDEGSITGTIMDCWQAALEDVGPAGVDKGKGGKYLILPPDYKEKIPGGYIVLPSKNYRGFGLLRSILKTGGDADIAKAVAYGKRIQLYPLSRAADPPPTKFVDAINVVFDSTIPYDIRFFESLDRMVQAEPWLERDKVMIDMLKSIGIEKGKPFKPDAKAKAALVAAATEAHDWLSARYETNFPPYFDGAQWALPALPDLMKAAPTFYETADLYPVDQRAVTHYWAFTTVKHLGAGQFYLMSIRDNQKRALDGGRNYRLHVPANPPVTQYWSTVAYDRATHALIRETRRSSRSSQSPGLRPNADGSVDIYFGPAAPAAREANWIPTKPDGTFEVLFRLYGPEKPLFDKTWKLPDIELAR